MLTLSSNDRVVQALGAAHDVVALAYTLRSGMVLSALEAAAQRGASVRVRLAGAPFGDSSGGLARHNRQIVAELAACGADARLTDTDGRGMPMHAKAVVSDGRLFLDDRNFAKGDFILADSDPEAARAVRAAADGIVASPARGSFAIEKLDALKREAALLRSAEPGSDVVVETESFGYGPVCTALRALAARQVSVRLLVCAREAANDAPERKALSRLADDGVRVRVCRDTEKFALAGQRAWVGSANASPAFGTPTIDWGLCTANSRVVDAARARVEAHWAAARPFIARTDAPKAASSS